MNNRVPVARGRIQEGARPSYAYVSGAAQWGSRASSSITVPRNDGLHPARRIGAPLPIIRRGMALHEVGAYNVEFASTISLLRVRTRYLRATYVRMWRCYANNRVEPFLCGSEE